MAELKTRLNDASVEEFLNGVADEKRRAACFTVSEIMRAATGEEPKMWGPAIVGFGSYRYQYASGREGDWMLIGFSPRKQNLTLYIGAGSGGYDDLLRKLGKHKTGKGCLYINKLEDIDLAVLRELAAQSVARVRAGKVSF